MSCPRVIWSPGQVGMSYYITWGEEERFRNYKMKRRQEKVVKEW